MDEKYTIAEDYKLPSEGKIYDCEINPYVKITSMTIRDEMKRTSKSSFPNKPYCEILDARITPPLPISTYDMAIGDYEYLLHKIRIVSYGPKYKMLIGCPHCDKIYEHTAFLDELKVKEFDEAQFRKACQITLPNSQKTIKLKFQTPRMLDNITNQVEEFNKKNPGVDIDQRLLLTLQESIDEVDGVKLGYTELETFVNKLSARDAIYLDNKIKALNSMIGIDTEINVKCNKCGGDIKTFFRFGPEFFRPTNDE